MEMVSPNMTAIIVMAVVYMAIGWLWYSPMLFGKMIQCPTKDNKNNGECCSWKNYVGEFVLALVIGYVLSLFVLGLNAITFVTGAKIGFWAWLGFVATTMYSKVLWAKKPMVNFYICAGFYLLMLVLMGGVFAVWQ